MSPFVVNAQRELLKICMIDNSAERSAAVIRWFSRHVHEAQMSHSVSRLVLRQNKPSMEEIQSYQDHQMAQELTRMVQKAGLIISQEICSFDKVTGLQFDWAWNEYRTSHTLCVFDPIGTFHKTKETES